MLCDHLRGMSLDVALGKTDPRVARWTEPSSDGESGTIDQPAASREIALALLKLGLACTEREPMDRPTAADVATQLRDLERRGAWQPCLLSAGRAADGERPKLPLHQNLVTEVELPAERLEPQPEASPSPRAGAGPGQLMAEE